MSRSYDMRVMISRYNPERLRDICAALRELWEFDPSEFPTEDEAAPVELAVSGVDNLTGGMTADDMAARLTHAVWTANGAYCEVEVWSTFLDITPPSDIHTWTEGDYQEWMGEAAHANEKHDHHVSAEH